MTTINLYQDQQGKQKNKLFGSGFLFSIGIITVVVLTLIGLKIASSFLSGQSEKLLTDVQNERNSLAGVTDIKSVVDMQMRLDQIKDNLQIKNNNVSRKQMVQVLNNMGAEINTGIVVKSYKYENDETNKNKISLTFVASNFNDVARQILNFKNSAYFTNFNLGDISRDGMIYCDVEMNLKS